MNQWSTQINLYQQLNDKLIWLLLNCKKDGMDIVKYSVRTTAVWKEQTVDPGLNVCVYTYICVCSDRCSNPKQHQEERTCLKKRKKEK